MQLEPLFGSLAVFLLGEQKLPHWVTIVGMLCCIPAFILLTIEKEQKQIENISAPEKSGSVYSDEHSKSEMTELSEIKKKDQFLF